MNIITNVNIKPDVYIKLKLNSSILILKLDIFEGSQVTKKINLKLNGVPTAKIDINRSRYKVVSGIFHSGPNIYEGHFTNMLRQDGNTWTEVNDVQFKKKTWPKSAKNVYILFLELQKK